MQGYTKYYMINPNGDEFTEDDPLAASMRSADEGAARRLRHAAGEAWEQTKEKAGTARERTEFFLRENPVPTVIGALALGVAIGLAIRYSSSSSEKEEEAKSPFGNVDLGVLSLPFLWPLSNRCDGDTKIPPMSSKAASIDCKRWTSIATSSRCGRSGNPGRTELDEVHSFIRSREEAALQSHFRKCRC